MPKSYEFLEILFYKISSSIAISWAIWSIKTSSPKTTFSNATSIIPEIGLKKIVISIKKLPRNTDSFSLNYYRAGSLRARYPQIKSYIYESADKVTMKFIILEIISYASFIPFW